MHRGEVNTDELALVSVDVFGREGRHESLQAVLVTGFAGHLTLPGSTIERLGLRQAGQRNYELANGELYEFGVYLGSASWHGRSSDVLVLESESVPLLGMTMLWGSRVTVDAVAGGEVTIEELTPEL